MMRTFRSSGIAATGVAAFVLAATAWGQPAATVDPDGPMATVRLDLQLVDTITPSETPGANAPAYTVPVSPPGDSRLFVGEKRGRVWIIEDGVRLPEPFLDISHLVTPSAGSNTSEQAMHGLAFHPDFAENGRFFVFFTHVDGNNSATPRLLQEYRVSADDPNRADPESGITLIAFPSRNCSPVVNPFSVVVSLEDLCGDVDFAGLHHNGGSLQFGPDGYLYITTGDGGHGGFSQQPVRAAIAQDPHIIYGHLLRIDVDTSSEDRPYGIPEGNMYGPGEGVPEAFAVGLRNGYAMTIDGDTLYFGDIGEVSWEEVNSLSISTGAGTNFGWGIAEGAGCFVPSQGGGMVVTHQERTPENQTCDLSGLTAPTLEIRRTGRSVAPGYCSVIGGHVYRGEVFPELDGHYFWADWCNGRVHSFKLVDGEVTEFSDWTEQLGTLAGARGAIVGIGVDKDGELYLSITSQNNGLLYKIVPAAAD